LAEILKNKSLDLAQLLAATRMDDDFKKNLLPAELGNVEMLSKCFGNPDSTVTHCTKLQSYEEVDLPPFMKQVLIKIVKKALSGA
jgi:hypothetical protein